MQHWVSGNSDVLALMRASFFKNCSFMLPSLWLVLGQCVELDGGRSEARSSGLPWDRDHRRSPNPPGSNVGTDTTI